MMTAKEAVDYILKDTPSILEESEAHTPMLFIFGDKGSIVVTLNFEDLKSKEMAMFVAGIEAAYLMPYCVALISEASMRKTIPLDSKQAKDMPDREKCLQVVGQSKDGEVQDAAIPFVQIGRVMLLGQTTAHPVAESYLLDLFWEGTKIVRP